MRRRDVTRREIEVEAYVCGGGLTCNGGGPMTRRDCWLLLLEYAVLLGWAAALAWAFS